MRVNHNITSQLILCHGHYDVTITGCWYPRQRSRSYRHFEIHREKLGRTPYFDKGTWYSPEKARNNILYWQKLVTNQLMIKQLDNRRISTNIAQATTNGTSATYTQWVPKTLFTYQSFGDHHSNAGTGATWITSRTEIASKNHLINLFNPNQFLLD